ncbi:MAG: hypothetical protein GC206_03560 [Alphaproteobacteria bacterium]|nr:hypothetical protein [Alphaproteobacteria bacterium]
MRTDAIARVLVLYGDVLAAARAADHATAVYTFAQGLNRLGAASIETLSKASALMSDTAESRADGPSISTFLDALQLIKPFMSVAAKPSMNAAIKNLERILTQRPTMSIRSYMEALSAAVLGDEQPAPETTVSAYVKSLTDALHDGDEFQKVFRALQRDKSLAREHIVEIASRFAFKMAKGTSKRAALDRIWKMHDASQAFSEKARSMGGKSAA